MAPWRKVLFFPFLEFTHLRELLLGGGVVTHGLVETPHTEVNIGMVRVQFFRLAQCGKSLWILLLVHQDGGNIEVRETVIASELGCPSQQGQSLFAVVALHGDVSEIGQGLCASRIDG